MTDRDKGERKGELFGLDMRPTTEWYQANLSRILSLLPEAQVTEPRFPVNGMEYIHLTHGRIAALIGLFPENAIQRSRLNAGAIIGRPSLYFRRDTTIGNIETTSRASEAISETAIIPAYTDNTRWNETGQLSSDVVLYEVPREIDRSVAEIIHAQGLIHEVAHTIFSQVLYKRDYALKMPNGEIVSGEDFMLRFAGEAEKYSPFSHYSGSFRKNGQEFASPRAIDEEFSEAVVGYLLGFVYSDQNQKRRGFDPFADMPVVKGLVKDFLQAQEE